MVVPRRTHDAALTYLAQVRHDYSSDRDEAPEAAMHQAMPNAPDIASNARTSPEQIVRATRKTPAIALLMLLASIVGLVGCGSRATSTGLIYRVNPPGVSVQALRVIDDRGTAELTLRLANHSTVATSFAAIEFELSLDGTPNILLSATPGLAIPALSSDVITIPVNLAPEVRAALDRAELRSALPYVIKGRITTESPDGRHRVEFSSRLNPVPGKPGEFR